MKNLHESRRQSNPERKINLVKAGKVAFALITLASFGRIIDQTLSGIDEQHGGNTSTKEQVVNMFTGDYNKWELIKDIHTGSDEDGYGFGNALNTAACIELIIAGAILKNDTNKLGVHF